MLVLGICDGHDSGACLAADGKVNAALSSERLTGVKRQPGFPHKAISWCLKEAGIPASMVDAVAVSEVSGRAFHRLFNFRYKDTNPNLPMLRGSNITSMRIQNFIAQNTTAAAMDRAFAKTILKKHLRGLGLFAPLFLVDHHKAHALSAAYGSGFENGLVVTMDAFGDGQSCTVWDWADGVLKQLSSLPYPHSPALLYGLVTSFLGFSEGDEGKVAGLAAKGDPEKTEDWFNSLFRFQGNNFVIDRVPCFSTMERALSGISTEDIAAGLQKCVEETAGRYVKGWIKQTGTKYLCLAGGLFANVKLNQAVAENAEVKDLYVFPHMGDGGLCLGAAWSVQPPEASTHFDLFSGPDPSFSKSGLPGLGNTKIADLSPDTAESMANLLTQGKPVGIVSDRMEFGPRALGNRSLLFPADNPKLADTISEVLNRPVIMPFAPAVRDEDFSAISRTPNWAAFKAMAATAKARNGIAANYPVAVHHDGTLRAQTVKAGSLLYDILTAYSKHKSPAMIINTSFNLHTEPIINSMERALDIFEKVPLAALVLGDKYIERR